MKLDVGAKMAELRETVDLRRSKGFDAALAVVTTDRGKGEMDAIRAPVAAMDEEEQDLREIRVDRSSGSRDMAGAVRSDLMRARKV